MIKRAALLMTLFLLLVSCQQENRETQNTKKRLTLLTHDSFAISEKTLAEFESEHNAEILLLPAGDTGAALNQAILAKSDPLADLFFGVDNTFLSRALLAEIFQPYASPKLSKISPDLILDRSNRLLPVDFGDVCLNYDKNWFEDAGIQPPSSLADLTKAEYSELLVVENPATSSPGLAFLLATIGLFGEEGEYTYLDFWQGLKNNDVLVAQGWEDAYFGNFSAASDGQRPLVVSYASSPPAEVLFAESPIDEPPTAAVTADNTCFRQIEFVGILQGTQHAELAGDFIDFMLDTNFQEDIPLNMFVYPANEEAELPDVFQKWSSVPETSITIDPANIEENREKWIEAWTDVVLR